MPERTQTLEPVPGPEREPPPGDRPRRTLRWPSRLEPLVVAVLASGLFVVGLGGGLSWLAAPFGGADLLAAYTQAQLWSEGTPYGNSSFGSPFGTEQRYYPVADLLQNALAGLVTWATDNPFLGIHTVYAGSFPATALAALWVLRIAGLRGPWAVLAALALTFIPWHWYRLEHVYLATMYSAVLGVGLALLVGNGTVERRLRGRPRGRFVLLLAGLVLVIATSGIYYACFTALLCVAAAGWRLLGGARWRDAALALVPGLAVLAVLAAFMLPTILFARAQPPLLEVAPRGPVESVMYAGSLSMALLPAPVSRIPGADLLNSFTGGALTALGEGYPMWEMHLPSNFGSLSTVTAMVIFAGGAFMRARAAARRRTAGEQPAPVPAPAPPVSTGLVVCLLVTCLAFFVPWGLSYLFAYVVTADIRAWNRLTPVLFTLVFLGAGMALRQWGGRLRPVIQAALMTAAVLVLLADSVLPARLYFPVGRGQATPFSEAGRAYAEELNQAVPGDCGVLQLPFMAFPEGGQKALMQQYDHLWPALMNRDKSWSFGAMKGTEAGVWQAALGDVLERDDLAPLAAGGFCAVHVDRRGYPGAEAGEVVADLTDLLGRPIATGFDGNWLAFALPGPVAEDPDVASLAQAPAGVGTFYAPPQVTPGDGAPDAPAWSLHHATWWLQEGEAHFGYESLPNGAAFTTVTGLLQAGDCGPRDVEITLRSGEQEVSRTVRADPEAAAEFSVELEEPVRQAQLTLATSELECAGTPVAASETAGATDLDETPDLPVLRDPGAVALLDPRAVN